jgi:16S rRNA (guanine(966)-N(2))-methyltransferase RsmD
MRIIAGTARGAKLETPDGEDTRPTLERVKENFFNAINFELEDAKVLDLFAGSGQLGLEALSRGARECIFVDSSAECIDIIRKNAQKAKLYDRCNILRSEYSEYLSGVRKRREFDKFDIVFLDPPYKDNARIIKEVIKRMLKHDFISGGGMFICEAESAPELDAESAARIIKTRAYKYGRAVITILNVGGGESERENMRDSGGV